jgi:hypothetical protein
LPYGNEELVSEKWSSKRSERQKSGTLVKDEVKAKSGEREEVEGDSHTSGLSWLKLGGTGGLASLCGAKRNDSGKGGSVYGRGKKRFKSCTGGYRLPIPPTSTTEVGDWITIYSSEYNKCEVTPTSTTNSLTLARGAIASPYPQFHNSTLRGYNVIYTVH